MIKLTRKDGKHFYVHRMCIFMAEPHPDGAQLSLMAVGAPAKIVIVKETPDEVAKLL